MVSRPTAARGSASPVPRADVLDRETPLATIGVDEPIRGVLSVLSCPPGARRFGATGDPPEEREADESQEGRAKDGAALQRSAVHRAVADGEAGIPARGNALPGSPSVHPGRASPAPIGDKRGHPAARHLRSEIPTLRGRTVLQVSPPGAGGGSRTGSATPMPAADR